MRAGSEAPQDFPPGVKFILTMSSAASPSGAPAKHTPPDPWAEDHPPQKVTPKHQRPIVTRNSNSDAVCLSALERKRGRQLVPVYSSECDPCCSECDPCCTYIAVSVTPATLVQR